MKAKHSIGRNLNVSFGITFDEKHGLGLDLRTQDVNWGLAAKDELNNGIGVSSGNSYNYGYYVVSCVYTRALFVRNRLSLEARGGIGMIVNFADPKLTDTALENTGLRQFSGSSNILYQLDKPTTINTSVKPLIRLGVLASYAIASWGEVCVNVDLQKGFADLIEQETSIIRKAQGDRQQYRISTQCTGIGFQLGFRIKV